MRYGIIGMGAVGAYFGAKLQQGGAEVHFLRRSRAAEVRQSGLTIHSVDGDLHLPHVQVYDEPHAMPPCDAVLVSLKATQNAVLPALLPTLLAPQGVVLVLQNGLDPEADAAAVVGASRVIGVSCVVCAVAEAAGVVRHWGQGSLTLGVYDPQAPHRTVQVLEKVTADLQRGGVPAQITHSLPLARWSKLMWNIPFNSLSAILRTGTHGLLAQPHSRALILTLMEEVRQAARAVGVSVPAALVPRMMQITLALPDYKSSMLVDLEKGQDLELDAILGAPLRAGLEAGAALPQIATVYGLLSSLCAQQKGVARG